MPLSDYLEDALADFFYNGVAYVPPGTYYVGLHTGDPTDAGGSEVTGLNYERLPLVKDTDFGAVVAGTGLAPSLIDLVWPVAGDAWGTITHTSINDALTVGNLLTYGPVPGTPRTIGIGDVYRIGAGNLSVGFE